MAGGAAAAAAAVMAIGRANTVGWAGLSELGAALTGPEKTRFEEAQATLRTELKKAPSLIDRRYEAFAVGVLAKRKDALPGGAVVVELIKHAAGEDAGAAKLCDLAAGEHPIDLMRGVRVADTKVAVGILKELETKKRLADAARDTAADRARKARADAFRLAESVMTSGDGAKLIELAAGPDGAGSGWDAAAKGAVPENLAKICVVTEVAICVLAAAELDRQA